MEQGWILNDQQIGAQYRLGELDRIVVDAHVSHHRCAHALRTETRNRLRMLTLVEGCNRQHLGGRHYTLTAAPVYAYLKHARRKSCLCSYSRFSRRVASSRKTRNTRFY